VANPITPLFSTDIRLTVVDEQVKQLFRRLPAATFRAIRDYMGRIFGSHRREWLAKTAVRLGVEGGAKFDREGFYGGIFGRARSFKYRIEPATKQVPDFPNLALIRGSVGTTSRAALGLELGGTWRARHKRFMAIPLKRALNVLGQKKKPYQSPATAKAAGRQFFSFVAKRTGRLYLAELISKGAGKNKRWAFKPTYRLVSEVHQKPILRFLETWRDEAPGRARRLEEAKAQILKELRS
jgi:hypothetical protein